MFCVAVFPKDKKLRVVLDKWVYGVDKKRYCFWPGASLLDKAVKQQWDADKDSWLEDEVIIKNSYRKILILFFL